MARRDEEAEAADVACQIRVEASRGSEMHKFSALRTIHLRNKS